MIMKTIKRLVFCLMAMFSVTNLSAQSIYDFTVKDDAGNDVSLADYKGTQPTRARCCSL